MGGSKTIMAKQESLRRVPGRTKLTAETPLTVLEQKFMSVVPNELRDINETLQEIAGYLKVLAENSQNK